MTMSSMINVASLKTTEGGGEDLSLSLSIERKCSGNLVSILPSTSRLNDRSDFLEFYRNTHRIFKKKKADNILSRRGNNSFRVKIMQK